MLTPTNRGGLGTLERERGAYRKPAERTLTRRRVEVEEVDLHDRTGMVLRVAGNVIHTLTPAVKHGLVDAHAELIRPLDVAMLDDRSRRGAHMDHDSLPPANPDTGEDQSVGNGEGVNRSFRLQVVHERTTVERCVSEPRKLVPIVRNLGKTAPG